MPPEVGPSDSEDDISLASTASSDQLEEYEVEAILAQRNINGIEQYLVKWEGYPYERCNWEPEESFCNPITLEEWGERRAAISRGEQPEFDAEALEDRIRSIDEASLERKGRRRAKRFRLGLLNPHAGDDRAEQNEEYEVDSLFDSIEGDEHLSSQNERRERATQSKQIQPTSHPKVSSSKNNNRLADASNRRQPILAPFRPGSTKQLAKRTIPRSAIGISTGPPNDLSSRIRQRKDHNFDPTDPARVQMFKNLSTKRRYEKASQREQAPDISQLDLRKPGDWLTSGGVSDVYARRGLWNHNHNSGSDSQSVNQGFPYQGSSGEVERQPFRQIPSQSNERVAGRRFTGRGRYWDAGEVLVTIRVGADGHEIGNARLCNLDLSTKRQILDTKERNNIDIWFRDSCTIEQYSLLCHKHVRHHTSFPLLYCV